MTDFGNLYRELSFDRPYNLHSHTQYCDGRATVDEFAMKAVEAGMSHYGFSPHSPLPIPSTCNMSAGDVDKFLADVSRLNYLYGDRIRLLASMEIDYLSREWGPVNDYFQKIPLDYRIGSVHFIPNQNGEYIDVDGRAERFIVNLAQHFRGDLRYVVETFFEQSLRMVEAGGFDIIGHLDKIAHNASAVDPAIESYDWYRSLVMDLIDNVTSRGIAIEINTKAYAAGGRFFPNKDLWPSILDKGGPIVVNSDAHYPDLINASRDNAIDLIKLMTTGIKQ